MARCAFSGYLWKIKSIALNSCVALPHGIVCSCVFGSRIPRRQRRPNGKRKVLRINARHQRRPRSFRKGDCLIFDIRILHGSAPNASPQEAQSRYTLRMASEDARIHYHGDWARAERCVFEEFRHREGDDINSEFFPALWKASQ